MFRSRAIPLALCAVSAGLLALVRCSDNNVSGGGTDTGNASVAAMLYNPGGTPAAGAKVRFIPVNYSPRLGMSKALAAVDSTVTDASGNYRAVLDSGTYNILAEGDSGVVYQDSITVIPDSTVRPAPDTLGAPGSIRGVVRLQPGDDSRTVFILFMGTRTWVTPDDAVGNFRAAGLAEGVYRVRILTTLDQYQVMDTVLGVAAGRDSVLPDTIRLRFTGIPVPQNVRLSYDTMKQIVTLTWDRADTGLVKGYNVYRRNVDSNTVLMRINASSVIDTVYRDSTGVQDQTYEYKVAAVSKSDVEGSKSTGAQVQITSYLVLDTTFSDIGAGPGQLDNPTDLAISRGGDIYIVDRNNSRIQVFDSTMRFKRQFGSGILGRPERISVDSLGYAFVAESDSVFVFDSIGVPISIMPTGRTVFDLAATGGELLAITDGDSVSAYSYDGTKKRTWRCGDYNSSNWIVAADSSRVLVSNSQACQVLMFDSSGQIVSATTMPYYAYSIAFDEQRQRLFTVCLDDTKGNTLHVTDKNNVELANYRIPSQPAEPVSVGLRQDGVVFLVLATSSKVLKLRSLLQ